MSRFAHMMRRRRVIVAIILAVLALGAAQAITPPMRAQSDGGAGAQVAPTPAPAAPTAAGRKRLEAPPLRPGAAALLIGSNLLLACGVVALAFYLRRRRQRTP